MKIGDRVVHVSHGSGTIVADGDDHNSFVVTFDNQTSMGDTLEVSTKCLVLEGAI